MVSVHFRPTRGMRPPLYSQKLARAKVIDGPYTVVLTGFSQAVRHDLLDPGISEFIIAGAQITGFGDGHSLLLKPSRVSAIPNAACFQVSPT